MRIETYHMIEHLPPERARAALQEWHRILTVGGILVIECPDFDEAVHAYLGGDDARLASIFGRQRFAGDDHRWGYNPRRLVELLSSVGFQDSVVAEPQDYHRSLEPCMRIEARK